MSDYVVVELDEKAASLLTRILNIEYRRLQLELRWWRKRSGGLKGSMV